MSVEKFNPSISGQSVPYTMVCNKVIQNIDNMEAFTVWVYLLSLPKDWNVVKDHVRVHFKIGEQKLKKIFSYLSSHKLIKTIALRGEDGRITKHEIIVLNGTEFTKKSNEINAPSTGTENHPVADHTDGKQGTTKKTINKKNKKQKENIKSGAKNAPSRTHIDSSFKPSDKHLLLAAQLSIDAQREVDKFIDYYQARGLLMSNWNAAFNNWLRKASEFERKSKKEHPITQSIRELKEKSPEFREFLLS